MADERAKRAEEAYKKLASTVHTEGDKPPAWRTALASADEAFELLRQVRCPAGHRRNARSPAVGPRGQATLRERISSLECRPATPAAPPARVHILLTS